MKDGIKQIVGKTITGVVVADQRSGTRRQMFLIFNDDTHFELWGDSFTGASGLDFGGLEKVRNYSANCGSEITMEISQLPQAVSGALSTGTKPNDFPRYCVLLVFFECLVGSLGLFLDHRSAGALALAGILAGVCYYIFKCQISRF